MPQPALVLPASSGSPEIRVHVNPLYALYHYLVREGQRPSAERDPAVAEAAGQAAQARHLSGVHGIWEVWEPPLANGATMDEVVDGLTEAMADTVTQLASGLRAAHHEFVTRIWPERQGAIQAALTTICDVLRPALPTMAQHQGALLDLVWPPHVDAYLVTDCYDWQGGYSHPLTIDVEGHTGLTLCETFLHEATHVADVYTSGKGKESFGNRLVTALVAAGIPRPGAWNAWHGVIFAASAQQVRTFIDSSHRDYASEHGVYQWLKVPELPSMWYEFTEGQMDESGFMGTVVTQINSTTSVN